ncbi:MAG TPA: YesL family protein [Rugosimonospora sp.]|nr:YesL family protein [Rugosimonospora sp.]
MSAAGGRPAWTEATRAATNHGAAAEGRQGTKAARGANQEQSASYAVREFGEGPLARVAARVYALVVVELLVLVAVAAGGVPLLFLARDTSNVPLVALCLVPVGPAVSAALYALHHHRGDLTDLRPARAFWRGYRMNLWGVLRLWVPWLAALAVIGVSLANLPAAGVPRWWVVPLALVALAAVLWMGNALVIASLFAFRTRDMARLGWYFLARRPGVALGNACLLVVAAGITLVSSELVLALLGSVFTLALRHNARVLIADVTREFTA